MKNHSIENPCCAYKLSFTLEDSLFKAQVPYATGMLKVSDLHEIFYAQYGNPSGIAVLCLHGGPGAASNQRDPRFFDLSVFRVIVFDQRGCGQSQPFGETTDNTTQALISDIEAIRETLNIDRWLLFGGSWGSALALAYGQAHVKRVLGFILRGTFLGTKEEYERLWYNMGDFYPEAFKEYQDFIPELERHDLIQAYHKRLMSHDAAIHMPAARAFLKYDFICATLIDKSLVELALKDNKLPLSLARLFAHYSVNQFFFTPDQIMKNMNKISHLPAIIIHGRYDIICRVSSSFRLYESWPKAQLVIVQDAGHSSADPGIGQAIIKAGEQMKSYLIQ